MKILTPPLLVLLALLSFVAPRPTTGLPYQEQKSTTEPERAGSVEPQYDDKGELKRPTDFRTWVFVGTNIGLEYRPDEAKGTTREAKEGAGKKPGNFHNVYINPQAHERYIKTGKFPDKTMLVLDIYKAEERDAKGIVSAGLYPGSQLRIEVAVKNSARPDGSKTDWAYYDFPPGKPSARAFPDSVCYQCHFRHADVDNVWVQFYPTLRMHKKGKE